MPTGAASFVRASTQGYTFPAGTTANIAAAGDITLFADVFSDALTGQNTIIDIRGASGSCGRLMTRAVADGDVGYTRPGGVQRFSATATNTLGGGVATKVKQWHRVLVTDGGSAFGSAAPAGVHIYIDATTETASASGSSGSSITNAGDGTVHVGHSNTANCMNGLVRRVGALFRVATPAEITRYMSGESPVSIWGSDLRFYQSFDDATITDSVNGATPTLVGTPTVGLAPMLDVIPASLHPGLVYGHLATDTTDTVEVVNRSTQLRNSVGLLQPMSGGGGSASPGWLPATHQPSADSFGPGATTGLTAVTVAGRYAETTAFPGGLTANEFTVVSVGGYRLPCGGGTSSTLFNQAAFAFRDSGTTDLFTLAVEGRNDGGTLKAGGMGYFDGVSTAFAETTRPTSSMGVHLWTGNGTELTVERNNTASATLSRTAPAATAVAKVRVGVSHDAANPAACPANLAAFAIWGRQLSPAERATLKAALASAYAINLAPSRVEIIEGSSSAAGSNATNNKTPWYQSRELRRSGAEVFNFARGGDSISASLATHNGINASTGLSNNSQFQAVSQAVNAALALSQRCRLWLWVGQNDLYQTTNRGTDFGDLIDMTTEPGAISALLELFNNRIGGATGNYRSISAALQIVYVDLLTRQDATVTGACGIANLNLRRRAVNDGIMGIANPPDRRLNLSSLPVYSDASTPLDTDLTHLKDSSIAEVAGAIDRLIGVARRRTMRRRLRGAGRLRRAG